LKIVFIALTQLAGDHGLSLAHVLNGALNSDDALKIEAIDVIDTANGDFRISVLHDSLNSITALSNNSTNKIVMCEDLQDDLPMNKQDNDVIIASTIWKLGFDRTTRIEDHVLTQ